MTRAASLILFACLSISLTACSGASTGATTSAEPTASDGVTGLGATATADIDFGAVPPEVFLAFFKAQCLVPDVMDPAGTFDDASQTCTRAGNKNTPVDWAWATTAEASQRRDLLQTYYDLPDATDAPGCPTTEQWADFAQPDVDILYDPTAPDLSDACLTSLLRGMTDWYSTQAHEGS